MLLVIEEGMGLSNKLLLRESGNEELNLRNIRLI